MPKRKQWNKGQAGDVQNSQGNPKGRGPTGFYAVYFREFAESYVDDFFFAVIILVGVALVSGLATFVQSIGFVHWAAFWIEWLLYITGLLTFGFSGLNFIMKLAASVFRSARAPAPRVPVRVGLAGYYDKHLRERAEPWIADVAKSVMVLIGVAIFEVFSRGVQLTGFSYEWAAMFENIDEVVAILAVAVVCGSSISRVANLVFAGKDGANA